MADVGLSWKTSCKKVYLSIISLKDKRKDEFNKVCRDKKLISLEYIYFVLWFSRCSEQG